MGRGGPGSMRFFVYPDRLLVNPPLRLVGWWDCGMGLGWELCVDTLELSYKLIFLLPYSLLPTP